MMMMDITIEVRENKALPLKGKTQACVRSNLTIHCSDTPFVIRQPIHRPHLLERVYKPIHISHWYGDLRSLQSAPPLIDEYIAGIHTRQTLVKDDNSPLLIPLMIEKSELKEVFQMMKQPESTADRTSEGETPVS